LAPWEKAAGVFLELPCRGFVFLFLRLPGVAITWFSVIKVRTKKRIGEPYGSHCALEKEKREGDYSLRAFPVHGLVQLIKSISFRALLYSSSAGQQYPTAHRPVRVHAARPVHTLSGLSPARAFFVL
jgi:hypothetical protein